MQYIISFFTKILPNIIFISAEKEFIKMKSDHKVHQNLDFIFLKNPNTNKMKINKFC